MQGLNEHALNQRIEEASLNAWPALQQVFHDGWVLRLSRGFTKRANCVVPLYADPVEADGQLETRIRYCEQLFARAGLPATFRLPTFLPSHLQLDVALAELGYTLAEPSVVLVSPPIERPRATSFPETTISLLSLESWLEVYCALTGMTEPARSLHRAILRGITGQCGFAIVGDVDHPQACGLTVVDNNLMGLFDIFTHARHRRRGVGRQLVRAMLQWGAGIGARRAYLQVAEDNRPAAALYAELGFTPAYRYWYRLKELGSETK